MLEVKDLHVNYGAVHALNGISLHVDDGEIVSLIGANGAGKTTTLRTITGLEKAASGSVMFDGYDLRKAEPSKIITYKLAHVPEGRHIFPQMTVEENLDLVLKNVKLPAAARPAACRACGKCARVCPQHIGIVAELARAAALFDIRLLDHIIVADGDFVSMEASGLLSG